MTIGSVVAASLVLLLPACSGGSRSAPDQAPTTETLPIIRTQPTATITPPAGTVESLTAWDHYVAWVGQSPEALAGDRDTDQVLVHDLKAQTTRVVAKTGFRNGTIVRVRGHGDHVVFLDQARIPSGGEPATPWVAYVASVQTGQTQRIAASAGRLDEAMPAVPNIAGPWVVWLELVDAERGTVRIRSFNHKDGTHRVLAEQVSAGQATIDDTTEAVFFDDENGEGAWDVYRVPADGSGPAVRVTSSGATAFPIARNGGVVWQQPTTGASDSLWYAPISSPERAVRVTGQRNATNAVPGKGFVLWADAAGKLLVSAARQDEPGVVVADASVLDTAARWSAAGSTFAFSTRRNAGDQATIHVVRVDVTP